MKRTKKQAKKEKGKSDDMALCEGMRCGNCASEQSTLTHQFNKTFVK
jgi:hypothetical protein